VPQIFEKGYTGNPEGVNAGRPKKTGNESDLRPLRVRLKKLNLKALPIIEASMMNTKLEDGSEPTKDQVATAKWVANTYVAVHKQVFSEENGKATSDDDKEKEPEVDIKDTKSKLSLVMLDK
jgi:hypothetical protein